MTADLVYTRSSPGALFFNTDGIGGCPKCGWRGIPTFTGGRTARINSILSFGDQRVKDRDPVPADVDHRCPACEREPDPSRMTMVVHPKIAAQINAHRRQPNSAKKRKAAKASRRRNR